MIKITIMEVPQYKLKELQEKITKREKEEAKKKEGKKRSKESGSGSLFWRCGDLPFLLRSFSRRQVELQVIGEKRPSSELLGWSLDLDQPIWKKAFFDEILCLARMHGLELWLVSCLLAMPGSISFFELDCPIHWIGIPSPLQSQRMMSSTVADRHMSLADS